MFDTSRLLVSRVLEPRRWAVAGGAQRHGTALSALMAVVQDVWKVTEVARRLGVARQSVHNWIARYEAGGLAALDLAASLRVIRARVLVVDAEMEQLSTDSPIKMLGEVFGMRNVFLALPMGR